MTNNVEHFCMFIGYVNIFFCELTIPGFWPFFIELSTFCLLICRGSLCLWIWYLCQIFLAHIFSHSRACLHILSYVLWWKDVSNFDVRFIYVDYTKLLFILSVFVSQLRNLSFSKVTKVLLIAFLWVFFVLFFIIRSIISLYMMSGIKVHFFPF